jgi:hypothetical protein
MDLERGAPADIPRLPGERVVVLDPPACRREWNAGRADTTMRPSLALDRVLAADDVARWLSIINPPQP